MRTACRGRGLLAEGETARGLFLTLQDLQNAGRGEYRIRPGAVVIIAGHGGVGQVEDYSAMALCLDLLEKVENFRRCRLVFFSNCHSAESGIGRRSCVESFRDTMLEPAPGMGFLGSGGARAGSGDVFPLPIVVGARSAFSVDLRSRSGDLVHSWRHGVSPDVARTVAKLIDEVSGVGIAGISVPPASWREVIDFGIAMLIAPRGIFDNWTKTVIGENKEAVRKCIDRAQCLIDWYRKRGDVDEVNRYVGAKALLERIVRGEFGSEIRQPVRGQYTLADADGRFLDYWSLLRLARVPAGLRPAGAARQRRPRADDEPRPKRRTEFPF